MVAPLVVRNPMRAKAVGTLVDQRVAGFHARMPAYESTPLYDVPVLAHRFGVARVVVKAETQRMGLPSFKVLGASWATYRAVVERLGTEPDWNDITELSAAVSPLRPLRLVAATDGNHGRAVAYMARLLGFECEIFVPAGMSRARVDAIVSEGAIVTVVSGTYDDAVGRAALEASDTCLVIADTSSNADDLVPAHVIDGYSTIFTEVDHDLRVAGLDQPDVVVIPVGVGSLLASAVNHYRHDHVDDVTIVGVEPDDANPVQMSVLAGAITTVGGPHESIMVGLNCDSPSRVAWPTVSAGTDWFVSIPDDTARHAMRDLAAAGIVAGETGAATLAGLDAFASSTHWRAAHDRAASTVLLVVTEGATDPENYHHIVGRNHLTVDDGRQTRSLAATVSSRVGAS